LFRAADRAAVSLELIGSADVARAHLLAGRVALDLGRRDDANRHFLAAARSRLRGPALSRANGWLSEALRAEAAGQTRRMFSACRHGLAVLDEHRFTLGASELRAQATAHGAELAALGQRHAARVHRPRLLLAWSERWRATSQAMTPARPPPDDELARELSALREVSRRLDGDLVTVPQVAALRRERARLEAGVRARILRTPGPAAARAQPFTIPALLRSLGGTVLVELIELDGVLHAVTVRPSGIRVHQVGGAGDAGREIGFARFLLRRLADGRPGSDPGRALADAGRLLEEALLGPAAADLDADAVVIVPPGRLNAIPWGLLPALRDRSVSVSPSAAAWLRASSAPEPGHRAVTLVGGPDLAQAETELKQLAELYPQAAILANGTATARRVLAALDDAWLAHVVAHGTFRAENPLFSSLQLDDGPLTVYDIEGIKSAPHRLVLSACEVGRAAPAGADELLGLAASLMPMGTVGIVAAIVAVNDQATPAVMGSLHGHVAGGAGFPAALRLARAEAAQTGDPIALATACSFIALGV
jgi:hypothetical protein